jgi:acetyltransferase-like isoleucine patch superfamily enzyme
MAVKPIPRVQDELAHPGMSAREKYTALIVGKPGLGSLINTSSSSRCRNTCPARSGSCCARRFIRGSLAPADAMSCSGTTSCLRHPHKIRIADNVVIDDNCLIDAKGESNTGIRIGSGVFIGRNTILSCKNGDIELADGVNIGFNCEIFSASRVHVGRNALIAAYSYLVGGDHDFSDPSRPVLDQPRTSAGISVGEGAWLGAGVKVLDGVIIGAHAVIGAGAVVRDAVPDRATAVGVPARIVGTRA